MMRPRLGAGVASLTLAWSVTITVTATVTASASASAGAQDLTPRQKLQEATTSFHEGEPNQAVEVIVELLKSELDPLLRAEALRIKAFCELVRGDRRAATWAWRAMLGIEPNYRLDPALVSPEFIAFFERIEPPVDAGETIDAEPVGPDASSQPPEPGTEPEDEPISPDLLLVPQPRGCGVFRCLVPFGVGQFANGNPVKGSLFAAAEAIFLGANIALFYAQDPDALQNETMLALQRTSLILFAVTAVLGIGDAFLLP